MRYLIHALLLISAATFNACSSLTECKNISKSEAVILPDVSDPKLFQTIRQDLSDNFGTFMQKSRLGVIQPCQRFTLRIAPIGAQESLDMSSQSIEISRKRQSIKQEQRQANPAPLVSMLKTKLEEYEKLSNTKEVTSGSTIINTLLKAIIQVDPEAETTLVLLTDGIENNEYCNMYKKIPAEEDIPNIIDKLIDPSILKKIKSLQQEGSNPKVIMVLKPATSAKVNFRAIKNYWISLLKQLKLSDVEFIDNIANINP